MNDRYLYRAKYSLNSKKWHIGNLVEEPDGLYLRDNENNIMVYIQDQYTICQCTGLKDKNGKLIWENDVVCTPYVDPIFGDIVNDKILDDYTWKVVFVDGGFCVENEDKIINLRSFTNGNHIKVIGNIFDNPELLEK